MIYVWSCGHPGCDEPETLACGRCGEHCTCYDMFFSEIGDGRG